ncbi:MAG: hypothetical protein LBF79_02305 [Dysgonamonadaceae bacterium]|jgi:hypothetical protein|nr:hypothetical protein [Dysgonamonadaceae bacterium]
MSTKNINQIIRRDLIQDISTGMVTVWKNGRAGQFVDINNNCLYRFLETTPDFSRWLISPDNHPEIQKLPIMACGFVAWLIKYWRESTQEIYSGYLQARLNQYKAEYKKDADVFMRNLEQEFYNQHRADEEQRIKQSEAIFDFISEPEVNRIKKYVKCYFEYVSEFNTESNSMQYPDITEQQKPNANEVNASKPQQYAFDPAKITAVYNFCIETNVLSNTI